MRSDIKAFVDYASPLFSNILLRQKHLKALFEHFSGTFPENYFFPRTENGNNNYILSNEDLSRVETEERSAVVNG